jgi:hypothetical protein
MVSSNISVKLYRENCGAQQRLPCFLLGEERSAARQRVANAGEGCLCVLSLFLLLGRGPRSNKDNLEPLLPGNFELPLLFGDS